MTSAGLLLAFVKPNMKHCPSSLFARVPQPIHLVDESNIFKVTLGSVVLIT